MTIWQKADELHASQIPFVIVTMIGVKGHAPQDPGAKAILTKDGIVYGTIGGGKVEAKAISYAKELISKLPDSKYPEYVTWNLQRDVGITCGSKASFLFETFASTNWNIVVFGAGHVAQALVRVLLPLDCLVTCIDQRQEWLDKLPQSPNLIKIQNDDPKVQVEKLRKDAFFVVMTQGHSTDMPIIEELFQKIPEATYMGNLGSDIKDKKVRNELKEKNYSANLIERLHCPIGLDLGDNHTHEIAISIAAQLLKVRDETRSVSPRS